MVQKTDLKKLNKYLWEIPKSFRKDMRVPARVYASEELLEDIFGDKSLDQLVNTTTLPGIVKYAIGMPDLHRGYGAAIGNVGATKLPDGIISPGFTGYDENCISPDTKILLENGAYLSMEELEAEKGHEVKTLDFKEDVLQNAILFNFFSKHNNPTIYQIVTCSGEKIKATGDHPIQTKQGMKKIRDLNGNESVLIHPFKGVKYEKPSSEVILSKEDFKRTLKKLGRDNSQGNAVSQILNHLNSRDLLPIRYNSPFLPSILRLMGSIFGDGVLSLGKDNKNAQVQFYAEPKDLKKIQKDIKELGFKPSRIYSRERDHSFTNTYGKTYNFTRTEHRVKSETKGLAYILVALGTPYGLKTHTPYRVPKWIFKCPLWQKRLFLASFFGAELSAPSIQSGNKYNFHAPQLNMNKAEELKKNARFFLQDIAKLLDDFGVDTYPIKNVPGNEYEGERGKTVGLRLQPKEKAENTIKLWERVGYEHNLEKKRKSCWAANYLKRKLKVVNHRAEVRERIREEYRQGKSTQELIEQYKSEYTPPQFITHSLFSKTRWNSNKKRGKPRIAFNFPSFEEYKEKYPQGDKGLVWDKIEEVEQIPYKGKVYDFTVDHPDHNFIADNFVVSNCGVRLLKSDYRESELKDQIEPLATEMQSQVPSGVGKGRELKFSRKALDKILKYGVQALVKKDYGRKEDIENCESQGRMKQADPDAVSGHAKNRGKDQVGTLGSGNHFMEVQKVAQIFDQQAAKAFGLSEGQIVVMIHTGSRGFGHQVCTDYLKVMRKAMRKYNIKLPDKQLACTPLNTSEGKRFFKAMCCGANYAWSNRQMITHFVRKAWKSVLGDENLKLLYDVAHNIAKIEEHEVDGKKMKLCVHRKGATRAFPPGHPEIPEHYREVGQPVLIPGSMGTPSYVCVGTEKSKDTFFSVNHGAGRTMSRTAATKKFPGREVVKKLEDRGIVVKCHSMKGIAEEASGAYKNINNVVEVVHNAGLSKKVVKLSPLAVIKGE